MSYAPLILVDGEPSGAAIIVKFVFRLHYSVMLCEKFRCSRVVITLTNFLEQHDI